MGSLTYCQVVIYAKNHKLLYNFSCTSTYSALHSVTVNDETEKTQAGQSVPPVTDCHCVATELAELLLPVAQDPVKRLAEAYLTVDWDKAMNGGIFNPASSVVHSGWSRGVEEILLAQPLNPIRKLEFEVATGN